jgi:hypothetical protein
MQDWTSSDPVYGYGLIHTDTEEIIAETLLIHRPVFFTIEKIETQTLIFTTP